MEKNSKILVLGSRGLVGSALIRELRGQGYTNVLEHFRADADLTNGAETQWYFSVHRPEYVFFAAARVGGIKGNMENQLRFFLDNMQIEINVLTQAADYGVKKLVFLGSSCIYPRDCPQPIKEEYLLTGPLEKTNEAYAIAKIAGVKLCQWFRKERGCDFVSAMPCNLYGPGDRFDGHTGHLVPGLMRRMHDAKMADGEIFLTWGDGTAKREILFSEDLARALIVVMEKYSELEPINTGSAVEMTVAEIAHDIARVVGFTGRIGFDDKAPVGTIRKLMDNSKIFGLGWSPVVSFRRGLEWTYRNMLGR